MDRAIPRRASVRDVANHAERGVREIARPEGVEEILAGIRRDPEFEKIVGDANRRGDRDELRRAVAAVALRAAEALKSRGAPGARADEAASCAVDEILGFGPLEYLLKDDGVTEIMVSGPGLIFFEKEGRLARAGLSFADSSQLLSVIERMLAPTGRRVDEASPMVDARLPDGSRLHAVIGPVAIDGPALTVRRFGRASWDLRELVRRGSMTSDAARFLSECVASRVSMVVSGGTGTGKTTMLAALASEIADGERIVTIEDAAELRIRTTHVVRLEARPPNVEGAGAISIRDLVRNALRMRPDRIVVGECRGAEAVDMLQAMNTGHEGSLTTVHANSPRDAVSRLETMALMAGLDLPICAVREQIARAIGVIVQLARVGAQRKVVEISEITGMEGQVISMQTLAAFDQRSGMLISTGLAPAHRCGADGTGHSHGIRGIA
ncbi:MAG: CpaF family protein [Proteobacteria bacterium]|nr:CpaF family protein [Pseudomonadota bacterium]